MVTNVALVPCPGGSRDPARCSQVHNTPLRVFNKHQTLPLAASFHSAGSDEVSVIHALSYFDLTEALPESWELESCCWSAAPRCA